MGNHDVATSERLCVVDGFAQHGESGVIAVLVLHFDPEAVGFGARIAVILHIDEELVGADGLNPAGFKVCSLAAKGSPGEGATVS